MGDIPQPIGGQVNGVDSPGVGQGVKSGVFPVSRAKIDPDQIAVDLRDTDQTREAVRAGPEDRNNVIGIQGINGRCRPNEEAALRGGECRR